VVARPDPAADGVQVAVADAAGLDADAAQDLAVGLPGPVGDEDAGVLVDQHRGRGQRLEDRGQLAELGVPALLGAVAGVDVAQEHRDALRIGERADLEPAVVGLVAVLELTGRPVREHVADLLVGEGVLDRGVDVQQARAEQFRGRLAQQRLGGGVEVGETALGVQAVDRVGDTGQHVGLP
jgi:hypothetical protein